MRISIGATVAAAVSCPIFAPISCNAHAIAGNRFFPSTMTFDDPAVADEFQVIYDSVRTPLGDGQVTNHIGDFAFARLLTDRIAIGAESGVIERSWGRVKQTGAMGTSVNIKTNFYRDDLNETLFATSLTYSVANSGSERVGARTSSSLQPALFAGQGLGNLPDSVAWLRPIGFVGAAAIEFPRPWHPSIHFASNRPWSQNGLGNPPFAANSKSVVREGVLVRVRPGHQ